MTLVDLIEMLADWKAATRGRAFDRAETRTSSRTAIVDLPTLLKFFDTGQIHNRRQ